MTPLYFGTRERKLFGVLHLPDNGNAVHAGVVLVPPFGHEAVRGHRFYRLLAERLSRQGVAALRFDLYGTGDSGGEDEDADLQGWASDIGLAHRELLRRIGGDRPVTWFGARLGGSVALRAAALAFPRVHRLVLWDAVFDGRAYLADLGLAQVEELEAAYCLPDAAWRRAIERDPLALSSECLGHAIPARLREQILALAPDVPAAAPHCAVTVIANTTDASARQWCEGAAATDAGVVPRLSLFDHSLVWTSNPFANNEIAPAPALQKIVSEFS